MSYDEGADWMAKIEELSAEIERLRAALDKIADSCCASKGCGCYAVVKGYAEAALSNQQKPE